MANAVFGEARCELSDGRDLTLRYDFNALCEMEEAAGCSFNQLNQAMLAGRAGLKDIRAALYGGLRHHHPDMTIADAGDLLLTDQDSVGEAMKEGMESMARAREEANPRKGTGGTPPSRGTGTRSTKRGAK